MKFNRAPRVKHGARKVAQLRRRPRRDHERMHTLGIVLKCALGRFPRLNEPGELKHRESLLLH